jgi:hypothetical protein
VTSRAAWRGLVLAAGALILAGCASRTGVVVATPDGSQRYVGERSRGAQADSVALTSVAGTECGADLVPTTEVETGRPAAFGGVRCEDGKIGMLLFSEAPGEGGGGPVSGVIDRRSVAGRWGPRVERAREGA